MLNQDIKTFAFFDLETTGLPQLEFNNTRITQLSIIACSVDHLFSISNIHNIPRITHKLSICLNPLKRISLKAEEITGMTNELLQDERKFDENTMTLLNSFFERLQQPICLVAHNGDKFDFPILKSHINKISRSLPLSLVCCDSLHVFRKIEKIQDPKSRILVNGFIMQSSEVIKDEEVKTINSEILEIEQYFKDGYTSSDNDDDSEEINKLENEFINFANEDIKAFQIENEKSPDKKIESKNANAPSKSDSNNIRKRPHSTARRELFPLSIDKKWPKGKFTLREIYFKYFNEYPPVSHDAEADVIALLKCACACNKQFIELVKLNCVNFSDVKNL